MSKKSLLWQISDPQTGQHSYLFGTMHVRDMRAFGWLSLAQKHLAECTVFATEFDFAETDPAALQAALSMPAGQDLQQCLSPSAWKNLDQFARTKLRNRAEIFRNQHPMVVSTTLSTAFLMEESAHSLDETLWHFARSIGKKTSGVESFADQIETLRRIPFEQHLKGLTWMLKNYGRYKKRTLNMMRRYAAGDIQALHKSTKKEAKGMRKILIYHRNERMVQRFIEIAREEPLFCAVGAGHLAGGKGMLRLLKKAGYRVKSVTDAIV